jgi:hypothetical protein
MVRVLVTVRVLVAVGGVPVTVMAGVEVLSGETGAAEAGVLVTIDDSKVIATKRIMRDTGFR